MPTAIRPVIGKLGQLPVAYEEMNIRGLVEWYKTLVTTPEALPLTDSENAMIANSWLTWITALCEREEVPAGWLSWAVNSLVDQELRLINTVLEESGA